MAELEVAGELREHAADGRVQVRGPKPSAPARRARSIRRTSTIDMRWTDGWGTELHLDGRGRDLATGDDLSLTVLSSSRMSVDVDPGRRIRRIETTPARDGLAGLVGTGAGSGFRGRLAEATPALTGDDPVDLLLDDIPGATLVSGFAFAQWLPIEDLLAQIPKGSAGSARSMEGICTGFMPGSSGLAPDGTSRWTHRTQPVESLDSGADAEAWHETTR